LVVLADVQRRRLAPLREHASRPAWLYTDDNDASRLARGKESVLDDDVLITILKQCVGEAITVDSIEPGPECLPLCVQQQLRTILLKEMPTLEDIGIAVRRLGDTSRGVRIPGAGGAATGDGSRQQQTVTGTFREPPNRVTQGKEKVMPESSSEDSRM
jgi:hypothetical protein